MKRSHRTRIARPQAESGYFLVESLVSVLIISIMVAGVMDGYSKIRNFNTRSQTQLQAAAIAQECIDQLRALDYNTMLKPNIGTVHQVPVIGPTPTGDTLFPRPLFRDTALTYYNSGGVDDTNNVIHVKNNQAIVSLASGLSGGVIMITVTVDWTDSGGSHTYVVETQLTDKGLNG